VAVFLWGGLEVAGRAIQVLVQYLDGERLGTQRREFASAWRTHHVRPRNSRDHECLKKSVIAKNKRPSITAGPFGL
jgi:hypothetical protein